MASVKLQSTQQQRGFISGLRVKVFSCHLGELSNVATCRGDVEQFFRIRAELKTGALVPAADEGWNIPLEYRMYGRGPFSPLVENVIEDLQDAIAREE